MFCFCFFLLIELNKLNTDNEYSLKCLASNFAKSLCDQSNKQQNEPINQNQDDQLEHAQMNMDCFVIGDDIEGMQRIDSLIDSQPADRIPQSYRKSVRSNDTAFYIYTRSLFPLSQFNN